ncbi:MAG: DUF192 domain-containing protein [Lysobacteraceae bacterium]|nr:MAG: DUF192 domain-containing protein [Xanthomonadaceae bacterium]
MEGLPMGALHRPPSSAPLVARAWRADSALARMRGLLGRPPLQQGEALLITACSSIHTVGMRYPLDVAFVDAGERVVKLCRNIPPLRAAWSWRARDVVEMMSGEIDRIGLKIGDRLEWRKT